MIDVVDLDTAHGDTLKIEQRYLSVEGRRVRYRRSGEGPPLVMLHGSPGDSAMLQGEMEAASGSFTCIALDTPGFGGSDPLPGTVLTVRDLAEATAGAIRALGLTSCRVFGTHSGAAIGIELGLGWPDLVSGLVLEGLPIFTETEIKLLFDGVFFPMEPDPLGGHLISTWVRFRDQFTWFPWHSRDVTRLNPVDRPTPEEIDQWVSMFYRSCRTFGPAYKAVLSYGQGAYRAAEATTTPTVYMASGEDMLFPHLDRLPELSPGQRIERLPFDPAAKHRAIRAFAESLPGAVGPTPAKPSSLAGVDPAMGFVDIEDGQVFVRAYGDARKPAVVLLHDAPGTGLTLEKLARRLSKDAYVVAPDLPGCGESSAPDDGANILEVSARAVCAIIDDLNLQNVTVAAVGCGAAVAGVLAHFEDSHVDTIIIENPPPNDPLAAEAIAPDLVLSPEGTHWVKAWLMLRDAEIYRPWFAGTVAAQRKTQGDFAANERHDQTVALMKSRATYHYLARAAFAVDTHAALKTSRFPVHIAADDGLESILRKTLEREPCT